MYINKANSKNIISPISLFYYVVELRCKNNGDLKNNTTGPYHTLNRKSIMWKSSKSMILVKP